MTFDKPKVTIDLDEYAYLQGKAKEQNKVHLEVDQLVDLQFPYMGSNAIWQFAVADKKDGTEETMYVLKRGTGMRSLDMPDQLVLRIKTKV